VNPRPPQQDYRMPKWVKLIGMAVIILVIFLAMDHIVGGGTAGMHHFLAGTASP
jgi:hypothetical protein